MDVSELTKKSIDELQETLVEKRTDLAKLRFRVREGQEKNVRKIRVVRKEIAQLLTAMHRVKLSTQQ